MSFILNESKYTCTKEKYIWCVFTWFLCKYCSFLYLSYSIFQKPLHTAAKYGSNNCLELLLGAGANVNQQVTNDLLVLIVLTLCLLIYILSLLCNKMFCSSESFFFAKYYKCYMTWNILVMISNKTWKLFLYCICLECGTAVYTLTKWPFCFL